MPKITSAKVDLPDPEGPTTAIKVPSGISRLIPERTSASELGYWNETFRKQIVLWNPVWIVSNSESWNSTSFNDSDSWWSVLIISLKSSAKIRLSHKSQKIKCNNVWIQFELLKNSWIHGHTQGVRYNNGNWALILFPLLLFLFIFMISSSR